MRATLVAVLLSLAGGFGIAAPAHAGSYEVWYCHDLHGVRASTSDLVAASNSPDGDASDACPSYYVLRLGQGAHNSGEQVTARINAPAHTAIQWLAAQRSVSILPTSTTDSNASPTFFSVFGDGSTLTGDGCAFYQVSPFTDDGTYSAPCRGVAWSGYAPGGVDWYRSFGASGTNTFAFVVGCGGAGTCGPSDRGQSRVTMTIQRVQIGAIDDSAPQASGATGSLTGSAPVKGNATLNYAATDQGAGVFESILYVDDRAVDARYVGGASCFDHDGSRGGLQFDQMLPCPLSVGFSHTIDTTVLAEGKHKVDVVAIDAGGTASAPIEQTIVVDNIPPPSVNIAPSIAGGAPTGGLRPGDNLISADGTWNGASIVFTHRWQRQTAAGAWIDIPNATGAKYTVTTDDVGFALRVVVTATNSEGTTSQATEATGAVRSGATVQTQSVSPTPTPLPTPVPSGGASGAAAPVASAASDDAVSGQLVLDREQKSIDVKYGAKIVITGRLVDANNEPIANADVDVFEQLVTTTAPWRKIATIKTDSQGGYVFRPTTTASRRLRFAWSNKIGTADYRATREVLVSVSAGMSIKAARRVVGRHDTIKLKGRVTIDALPATGQWVEIQVLDSGLWRTVATRKLSSKGGWSFKHHLTSSSAITFAFRSRLRATGEIAAVESHSPAVKVRVR